MSSRASTSSWADEVEAAEQDPRAAELALARYVSKPIDWGSQEEARSSLGRAEPPATSAELPAGWIECNPSPREMPPIVTLPAPVDIDPVDPLEIHVDPEEVYDLVTSQGDATVSGEAAGPSGTAATSQPAVPRVARVTGTTSPSRLGATPNTTVSSTPPSGRRYWCTRDTRRRVESALGARQNTRCLACNVRFNNRKQLMRHANQHYFKYWCACGFGSRNQNTITKHKNHSVGRRHTVVYEVDEFYFSEFKQL